LSEDGSVNPRGELLAHRKGGRKLQEWEGRQDLGIGSPPHILLSGELIFGPRGGYREGKEEELKERGGRKNSKSSFCPHLPSIERIFLLPSRRIMKRREKKPSMSKKKYSPTVPLFLKGIFLSAGLKKKYFWVGDLISTLLFAFYRRESLYAI